MGSLDLLLATKAVIARLLSDYEVEESITTLRELLQKNFRVMTSFERYEKELRNGQLMFGKTQFVCIYVDKKKFWFFLVVETQSEVGILFLYILYVSRHVSKRNRKIICQMRRGMMSL